MGDRVRPLSGPYRRIDFVVVGIKGDRLSVEGDGLKLSFPAKFLKRGNPIKTYGVMSEKEPFQEGKAAIKTVIRAASRLLALRTEFVVGDRVQHQKSDCISGEIVRLTGEKAYVRWDGETNGRSTAYRPENLKRELPVPQPPEKVCNFVVGDRVTFAQYWYGELHSFEGTVREIDSVAALVDYEIPKHLQDGTEHCCQIQSAIATFAKAKVAEVLPPKYSESESLLAQIAAIRAEGAIAPDHCWIERWQRSPNFIEARYKARSAIFPSKRGGLASCQYIGKVGSPEYSSALDAVERRNRIGKLRKKLENEKC